jgi:hypothetical protein
MRDDGENDKIDEIALEGFDFAFRISAHIFENINLKEYIRVSLNNV